MLHDYSNEGKLRMIIYHIFFQNSGISFTHGYVDWDFYALSLPTSLYTKTVHLCV